MYATCILDVVGWNCEQHGCFGFVGKCQKITWRKIIENKNNVHNVVGL